MRMIICVCGYLFYPLSPLYKSLCKPQTFANDLGQCQMNLCFSFSLSNRCWIITQCFSSFVCWCRFSFMSSSSPNYYFCWFTILISVNQLSYFQSDLRFVHQDTFGDITIAYKVTQVLIDPINHICLNFLFKNITNNTEYWLGLGDMTKVHILVYFI